MRYRVVLVAVAAAGITLGAAEPAAQSLAGRVRAAKDGELRLAYAAREGVCGDGRTYIRDRSRGEGNFMMMDSYGGWGKGWRNRPCEDGPVRVTLRIRDGQVRSAKTYVGGEWPEGGSTVTDLGTMSAREAAMGLIELARIATSRGGEEVIFPATIADSFVAWRPLLSLAKDPSVHRASRKQAIVWVSQAAGDKAAEGLGDLVGDDEEDREIREQAVFALSQLPNDEGIPILLRVARTNKDREIRKKAMFWLGQSDDPRALALFEEILSRPN
jgi:hypothetical protein